ncbi:Sodium Bile acid symporter family protein [compost metagenome]
MANLGFNDLIRLLLAVAVPVMMISIGMHLDRGAFAALWRRPGLLARSILAPLVLCPLAAYLLTAWFKAPLPVALGLLLTAATPSAPLGFVQSLKAQGDAVYVADAIALLAIIAVVSMPLTVWAVVGDPRLTPAATLEAVGLKMLLPLGVGMALRACFPAFSRRIRASAPRVIPPLIALCVLPVLFRYREHLAVGWPTALTMLAVASAMLAIGYGLGGPQPSLRLSLALLCGFRNAAIPMMLVAPHLPQALLPIAVFSVFSALLSLGFATLWRKRHPPAPGITLMREERTKIPPRP